ncbi:SHOCT domain-containing protein [Actinoplanes sp. NEAU-A12]|uniref:SHOCT domain-containing protein n=1 Tax=Actinoplanes sandaracinus TaxID=3045177 RepID=A0ABT6X066_9ACTN|nr:SHOCT domain-containing protein [Actinoplanes sandaracinus]MDI6105230.1 SHOCT domain-containing protein [Actinoplanes sandaracinus]
MPGLLRGMARTAVIAGTATAVSHRVSRRQMGRWSRQSEDQQEEYAEPAPAEPRPDPTSARLDQLRRLGELRTQGVLTDAEFEQQKTRILAS